MKKVRGTKKAKVGAAAGKKVCSSLTILLINANKLILFTNAWCVYS